MLYSGPLPVQPRLNKTFFKTLYIRIYVSIYIYILAHNMCVGMRISTHACIYISCVSELLLIYVSAYVCVYLCMYVRNIHVCIYVYMSELGLIYGLIWTVDGTKEVPHCLWQWISIASWPLVWSGRVLTLPSRPLFLSLGTLLPPALRCQPSNCSSINWWWIRIFQSSI